MLESSGDPALEHLAERAAYVTGSMRDVRALNAVVAVATNERGPVPVRAAAISAIGDIVHRNQRSHEVSRGLDVLAELVDGEPGPLTAPIVQAMAVVRRTRFERHFEDPPARWPERAKQNASWGKELLDDPMLPAAPP
jgi:hypothetical protein